MRSGIYTAAAVLTLGAIASCGGGSHDVTGPPAPTVATITLSQTAITLEAAFNVQISAVLKTSTDSVLTGIPVTWQSDNPAVATVSVGIIEAVSVGSAKITASAGGKTATATVNVIPTVISSIRLSRTTAALAPEKTLQLTADPVDRLDRKITSRTVTFSSSDTVVADVNNSGLVTAKAVGLATITASAADKQAQVVVTVALPRQLSIATRGAIPAGFVQLSSYSIKLRQPDDSLSATIPIGAAATLSGSMVLGDVVQILATGDATTQAATLYATEAQMPSSIPVVLIPLRMTLTSGPDAGTNVAVNLVNATTPCLAKSDQCLNGFYGNFRFGVVRWASYPIPVSIDASLDSSRIWDALRAMESAVGMKMFVVADGGYANKIDVRAGLPPGISGFGGYTTWNWDSNDRMTSATVWLASGPNRTLVQHEFLHALGFWHTCSWASVMGGYGCPQALEISSNDVAYLLLASAIYDAETTLRTSTGSLPCGLMSIWAAIPNPTQSISCFGDSLFPNSVIRQESAQ
jgi:hypothetical protein